ncbi:MAG: PAS domain S-box protein [Dehalococcoidia bacterium]|jgi:PAS domain S-box-containing protein
MNVLIVEDNADSRNLLAKQLRAYGHEVTAVADGFEALEQARKSPPDILVSDILMPRMDGYKLCYEWKQDKRLKAIPFVFYTAIYTSKEDEKFGLSLGASLFIRKPIEPESLARILSQVFEQAREGKLLAPEAAPPKPSLYLTEYNERLVAKLNEKVAELEASENELRSLSSVLMAIRNINQLIVREKDKPRLLQKACRILHRVREYRFVWIGLIEEGHKRVIPVAKAGVEHKYLDSVKITWDDSPSGRGPTGMAIKTRQPDLLENIAENPRSAPWREEARKRGYNSSAAIPLIHGGKVYGALNVYSSETDGFSDAEIDLLVEMSGDLAFAIKAIDEETARQRAEHNLKERMKEIRCLYNVETIGNNPALSLDEIYRKVVEVLPPGWQYPEVTAARLSIDGKVFKTKNYVDKDGGWKQSAQIKVYGTRAGEVEVVYLEEKPEFDEGPFLKEERQLIDSVAGHLARIIERKRADEALEEERDRAQRYLDISAVMIMVIDKNKKVSLINQKGCQILGCEEATILGKNWFQNCLPERVRAEVEAGFEKMMTGEVEPMEYHENPVLTKSGEERIIAWHNSVIRDDNGRAVATLSSGEDITERKKAEEALEESEKRLSLAVEGTNLGLWDWMVQTGELVINERWASIVGYTVEELSPITIDRWIKMAHPDDLKISDRLLDEHFAGKSDYYECEVRIKHKNGEWVWVLDRGKVVERDEEGKPVRMTGTHLDITERHKADEALRESNQRFADIAENALEWIWEVDAEGKYTYSSPVVEEILGYKPKEMLGKHFYDLFLPDEREELKKSALAAFAKKQPFRQFLNRNVRKDGKVVWLSTSGAPIVDEAGKLIGYRGADVDITESKEAEEKLQRSEANLAEAQRVAHIGSWEMDVASGALHWSDEVYRIYGMEPQQAGVSYDTFKERIHPEDRDVVDKAYTDSVENKTPYRVTHRIVLEDGTVRYVDERGETFYDDQGEPYRSLGTVQDITERKLAEEALEESEKRLSLAVEGTNLGLWDWNVQTGEVVINERFAEMVGYTVEDLSPVTFDKWFEFAHPDDLKISSRLLEEHFAGKSDYYECEARVKHKNGEWVWVLDRGKVVERNKEGKPVRMTGIHLDITERKRAVDALRESEAFQAGLLSNSPIPITVLNPDGSLKYVSPALVKLTGFSAKELVGQKPPYPFWPKEHYPKIRKGFDRAMTRGSHQVEELFKKKNGDKLWVEITTAPVKKDGELLYVITSWVDVTERRKAEEALRESEARYRAVIEGAHDMIQSVGLDGSIIFVNKAWRDTLGYTEADLPGLNLFDVIHPDVRAHCEQMIAEVVKGKPVQNIETAFSTKDGRKILVEGNAAPRYIGKKVVATQGIFRDVTERKLAEEALRESEAFQSELLANSPIPISVINPDTSVRYVNPAMVKLTGFSAEELTGEKAPYCYWAEEWQEKTTKGLKKAMRQGGDRDLELFKRKNGQRFWVEITSVPVKKDGKFQYLLVHWVDITERKQAQDALADEATRHRILIDESGDGIVILDEEGKVYEANRRFAEMLGYTPEETAKLNVWDWEASFPREQVAEMIASVGPEGDHFETRHRRKDGSLFDVEISTNGADYAGQKLIFCVVRDITERKRAAAALKESEEKYKNLVEATSDIIWETDTQGFFTFISPKIKDVLGYEVDEVVGKMRTLDFIAKGESKKWLKRFKEVSAKKEPFFGFEIPHLRKDGSRLICETSGIPLFDGAGNFKGYVGINRDITERRQMQEQLVIADRLASVGELAAGIAHELNNPLTGVIGFSQLLLDKKMPEDVRQDLNVVYSEAQRASQVVKNLLTFARKHAAAKQQVNINEIIQKVLELRAYEQNLENIVVDARLDPKLPEVMADYFQLQQVFLNIIINAEYFMKEAHNKGTLTIITEKVGNKVKASFADDGPGVKKDDLGHLFDPFFTTKEVGKGTGLGLSICHGIVAEHGGRIYVESEPGKGATFIVELPVGAAQKKGGRRGK